MADGGVSAVCKLLQDRFSVMDTMSTEEMLQDRRTKQYSAKFALTSRQKWSSHMSDTKIHIHNLFTEPSIMTKLPHSQQTTTGIAKGWYTLDVYDEELGPGRIEAKPTPSPASAASGNRRTTALEIGIGEFNVGNRLIKSRGLRQAPTQHMLATQS